MQVHADPVPLLENRNALGLLIESRVLDCDCGLSGQGRDGLLILETECRPAMLFGQIEIAQRRAAPTDRRPQEAAHRWVVRWKSHRRWVVLDIAQPQRVGLTLKQSQ